MDNDLIKFKEYEEIFRTPNVIHWEAGIFDYELIIRYTTDEIMNMLNDWLCDNCSENFVVLRITYEIAAGGNINPKSTWERRKKAGPPTVNYKGNYDVSMNIHVRLCMIDVLAFRLTWIL